MVARVRAACRREPQTMTYRRELQFGILLLSTGLIFLVVVGILGKAGF